MTRSPYDPTETAAEENLVASWHAWAPGEVRRQERSWQSTQRRALRSSDRAQGHVDAAVAGFQQRSLEQLEAMLRDRLPYFARIRARLQETSGETFTVDVRVHKYQNWVTVTTMPPIEMMSHLTAIADLVRNPSLNQLEVLFSDIDHLRGDALGGDGRLTVLDCLVEDVDVDVSGQVRVAPRYGAVYEDRVRRKLGEAAESSLDLLGDVLDRRQNEIVADRDPALRLLVLDGPAGTGKTAVAAHRLAVVAPRPSSGWYLAPTPLLRDYVGQTVPRLMPAELTVLAVTLHDLCLRMWPELTLLAADGATTLADLKGREPEAWVQAFADALGAARRDRSAVLAAPLAALSDALAATPQREADRLASRLRSWSVDDGAGALRQVLDTLTASTLMQTMRGLSAHVQAVRQALSQVDKEDWHSVYAAAVRRMAAQHQLPVPEPHPLLPEDHPLLLLMGLTVGRTLGSAPPAWVVADEAQSFSPLAYAVLRRLAGERASFVLSGDLMQHVAQQRGLASWGEAADALGIGAKGRRRVWLALSYRLPVHIHELSERLRRAVQPDAPQSAPAPWHQERGRVEVLVAPTAADLAARIGRRLQQASDAAVAAIALVVPDGRQIGQALGDALRERGLTPQWLDGREPYRGGLAVGTARTVQGLEFDWVFVLDVEEDAYPRTPAAAHRLYTAITRARRALFLCSRDGTADTARPSPWLQEFGL